MSQEHGYRHTVLDADFHLTIQTMSSPVDSSPAFDFKVPLHKESDSTSCYGTTERPFIGDGTQGVMKQEEHAEHIIPGGDFDGLNSSPCQTPTKAQAESVSEQQPQEQQPASSLARFQISSARQTDEVNDQPVPPSASPYHHQGDLFTSQHASVEHRGHSSFHQVPESSSFENRHGQLNGNNLQSFTPSTATSFPISGRDPATSGQPEYQYESQPPQSPWGHRNPPPLTSSSSASYTTAMTPSTGRTIIPNQHHPMSAMGFQPPQSHLDGNEAHHFYHQQASDPQKIRGTPEAVSRRPALATTPNSGPSPLRFGSLPTRQLPGPLSQPVGSFVLPSPHAIPPMQQYIFGSPAGHHGTGHPPPAPQPQGSFMGGYSMPAATRNSMSRGSFLVRDPVTGEVYLQRPPTKPPKEHRCSTCNKSFARPSALQTHQAVHTGAKRGFPRAV